MHTGRYTSRLYKAITKAFFPQTYEALKILQQAESGFGEDDETDYDGARRFDPELLRSDLVSGFGQTPLPLSSTCGTCLG